MIQSTDVTNDSVVITLPCGRSWIRGFKITEEKVLPL